VDNTGTITQGGHLTETPQSIADSRNQLSPSGPIDCSVVIAIYNEAANVPQLVESLSKLEASRDATRFEFILVNDGSKDRTLDVLLEQSLSEAFNIVDLEYNVGQVEALSAGVSISRGATVIVTDGDLQFDLLDSGRFLNAHNQSRFDLIASRRSTRKDRIARRAVSTLFSMVLRIVFGFPFAEPGSNFRLIGRPLLERCRGRSGKIDFNIMMFSEFARSRHELEIVAHSRQHGSSHWTFKKLVIFYLSLIVYSRTFPVFMVFANIIVIVSSLVIFALHYISSSFRSEYITAPSTLILSAIVMLMLSVTYAMAQYFLLNLVGIGAFRISRIVNRSAPDAGI
jgi:polyisoprenyl-phosphate glycosyltransferase